VEDHCDGILMVLEHGALGEHYNIGGRNERTNLEIVDGICSLLDELRPPRGNPALRARGMSSYRQLKTFVADRPGHDQRYAIDASKISTTLGWSARHSFDSGLEKTVRWYLENSEWCEAVRSERYAGQRLGLAAGAQR
jgi:dTDP-glucose 4,6-dehydratase